MEALDRMRALRDQLADASVRVVLVETVAINDVDPIKHSTWGPFTPALAAELDRPGPGAPLRALERADVDSEQPSNVRQLRPGPLSTTRFRVRIEQWGSGSLIDGSGSSLFEALGNALELAGRVGWLS